MRRDNAKANKEAIFGPSGYKYRIRSRFKRCINRRYINRLSLGNKIYNRGLAWHLQRGLLSHADLSSNFHWLLVSIHLLSVEFVPGSDRYSRIQLRNIASASNLPPYKPPTSLHLRKRIVQIPPRRTFKEFRQSLSRSHSVLPTHVVSLASLSS